jgi:hypothetical protein
MCCLTGCSTLEPSPAITLATTVELDHAFLEQIRGFAEKQLQVPVRADTREGIQGECGLNELTEQIKTVKTESDALLIVLAAKADDPRHLIISKTGGVAVINMTSLHCEDAEKFARRIERQVMRAAAFCFGLSPTPDPFCVTRNYYSLEDLDRMGRNFSPPWTARFLEEAEKRGLINLKPVLSDEAFRGPGKSK